MRKGCWRDTLPYDYTNRCKRWVGLHRNYDNRELERTTKMRNCAAFRKDKKDLPVDQGCAGQYSIRYPGPLPLS